MYAIIETGGKQYRVAPGETVRVELLDAEAGAEVTFDKVLAVGDQGKLTIGMPTVSGARVLGKVMDHGRGPKITVFKYRNKANYRKKTGHRQPFTQVLIEKIEA